MTKETSESATMAICHRKRRRIFPFSFLILLGFFVILIVMYNKTNRCPKCPWSPFLDALSTSLPNVNISTNIENEPLTIGSLWVWCPEIVSHLSTEKEVSVAPHFIAPLVRRSRLHRLPYRYSDWKSSPLLPRRITPCEHYLSMRLLMIIDQICRENKLTFAMSDGTLLGSWRHHDLIPWDDDIDLMMPIEDQLDFLRALARLKDTVVQFYLLEQRQNKQLYAKVFFQYAPLVAHTTWTFPFVDVFFYITNDTHLWYLTDPSINMQLQHVFPLVMRPLGYFWLPAPREPKYMFHFDAQNECDGNWHDHRKERSQKSVRRNCSDLIDVYPFVQRNKTTRSVEVLMINHTVIHTVTYPL